MFGDVRLGHVNVRILMLVTWMIGKGMSGHSGVKVLFMLGDGMDVKVTFILGDVMLGYLDVRVAMLGHSNVRRCDVMSLKC
jgi:hypothetical protein